MRTPSRFRAALVGAALTTLASTGMAMAPAHASDHADPQIVGGHESDPGAYPWMAKLSIEAQDGTYLCGGTLVSPDVIVTAQHCMEGAQGVTAYIGENNPDDATPVEGTDWKMGEGPEKSDWAVIKLAEPVDSDVMPVLSDGSADEGPTFRAMGWGTTSEGGDTPDTLMEVDLPYISDADCGTGDEEVCAGDLQNGGIDTCQGDSGGPLVNLEASDRPVLVGITSWGNGCARPGEPGHYAQVSTFVNDITGAIDELGGTQPTLN